MTETRQPMFATKVRKWCENCFKTINLETGEGEMIATGLGNQHRCNKCSKEAYYEKQYPRLEFSDRFAPAPFVYDEPTKEEK